MKANESRCADQKKRVDAGMAITGMAITGMAMTGVASTRVAVDVLHHKRPAS